MTDARTSRRLALTASLLASGAMVAASSAFAWPAVRHFIAAPAANVDVSAQPAVAATAATGSAGHASGPGLALLAPAALTEVVAAGPAAGRPAPADPGANLSGEAFALLQGNDSMTSQGRNDDSGFIPSQPPREQTGLTSSEDSTPSTDPVRPRLSAPRPALPSATSGDLTDQRMRLQGHWSIGKFR